MNKRQKKKAYKKKYGVNPTDQAKAICEFLNNSPDIFENLNEMVYKTVKAVCDLINEFCERMLEDKKDVGNTEQTDSQMALRD